MRHSNPHVEKELKPFESRLPKNVSIVDPMPRRRFLKLISTAELVLTDSGGVQEEAAALCIPTLVARNVLDRQDGTANGIVQKVGTDPKGIRAQLVSRLIPGGLSSASHTRGLELSAEYRTQQVPRHSARESVLNALQWRKRDAGPAEDRAPGELATLIDDVLMTRVVNHRGDVAGEFSDGLSPVFYYPEIAGYFLSWLARTNRRHGLRARTLALKVSQRLASFGSTPPPTRYGQVGGAADWRKSGIFLFDLAMIAKGLADCFIAFQGGSQERRNTASVFQIINKVQVECWLEPFMVLKQDVVPALVNWNSTNLPVTWSTTPGPYQLKVFAALEHYATTFDHPDWLGQSRRWAAKQLESLPVQLDHSENMLHPGFYCCEGLLAFGKHDLAARLAEDLVRATVQMLASGVTTRLDIHAQALRLSMVFFLGSEQTRLLYQTLSDRLRHFLATGSFGSARTTVWGLIFASEALRLVSRPAAEPHVIFT